MLTKSVADFHFITLISHKENLTGAKQGKKVLKYFDVGVAPFYDDPVPPEARP
jgi:hypothetical protein